MDIKYNEYEFKNECLREIKEQINIMKDEPFDGWWMVQKLVEYHKIYTAIPTYTWLSNHTKYKYMIWCHYLVDELVLKKASYEDLNMMMWGLEDSYENMEWYLKSKVKANLNKANEKYKEFKEAKARVIIQLKYYAKERGEKEYDKNNE